MCIIIIYLFIPGSIAGPSCGGGGPIGDGGGGGGGVVVDVVDVVVEVSVDAVVGTAVVITIDCVDSDSVIFTFTVQFLQLTKLMIQIVLVKVR